MNWRLIIMLSLFGLAMAVGTVYFIPSNVEPFCWLAIFFICAYIIAKNAPGKYFLHGFLTSLINCVWITSIHIIMSDTYIANHAMEAEQTKKMFGDMPLKESMAIMGPIVGIASGLVLGLFSWIASMLFKKKTVQA